MKQPTAFVLHKVSYTGHCGRERRKTGRHGFECSQTESFVGSGRQERIMAAEQFRNIVSHAKEDNLSLTSPLPHLQFQLPSQRPLAYYCQRYVWKTHDRLYCAPDVLPMVQRAHGD
ncbi:hypothetical protein N866_13160 [Actinotalea ferrariae CF5-4]|uniref:Uncharacterized protein n=1 Tax=Actinotalea ferrariae CF5-4 TaxID=948458 RepID=A0A021VVB7_9CELL|nr:hypothetical protein N866_13160 [Actinotalea ferrariae CF5-4]